MADVDFSRRYFYLAGASLAVSASALIGRSVLTHAGADAAGTALEPLLELQRFRIDPVEVAAAFRYAPPALLLSSYGNFFPNFMLSTGFSGAPRALRDAARSNSPLLSNPENPHRLEALPAVAAAHALPFTDRSSQEELLSDIVQALTSKNREVREIVLQNLITASLPSPENQLRWTVNERLLRRVIQVIEDAKHASQLLSPAALALTMLLNTRATLKSNGSANAREQAAGVDRLVRQALSHGPEYFVYLKRLKKVHELEFAHYDPHDASSLPSHTTEMILQARHSRRGTPDYNSSLALIHARTTFDVWRTAEGLPGGDDSVMTKEQAKNAFPKMLSYEVAVGMLHEMPTLRQVGLPTSEQKFEKFMLDELVPRLREHEGESNSQREQLQAMSSLPRPLASYRGQGIADRVGPSLLQEIGNDALGLMRDGAVGLGIALGVLGHQEKVRRAESASRRAYDLPGGKDTDPAAITLEEIARELERVNNDIGEAPDIVQDKIGPAKVWRDSD